MNRATEIGSARRMISLFDVATLNFSIGLGTCCDGQWRKNIL